MILLAAKCLIGLAMLLSLVRLVRGPTAADRVLAIDLMAVVCGAAVLLYAIGYNQETMVDIVVVLGAIIFFGTVAVALALNRPNNE